MMLDFDTVTAANRSRSEKWHPGFPHDDSWSGADWSNAMCGEAGEAANVVKKLRRIETSSGHYGSAERVHEAELLEHLAEELADTYIYLDLLATKYGINLPAAIVSKFNKVSERAGFPERLYVSVRGAEPGQKVVRFVLSEPLASLVEALPLGTHLVYEATVVDPRKPLPSVGP